MQLCVDSITCESFQSFVSSTKSIDFDMIRTNRTILLVAALFGALLPVPQRMRSQVVGASISGIVKDAAGGGIPGATVVAKNIENAAERKVVTDASGR